MLAIVLGLVGTVEQDVLPLLLLVASLRTNRLLAARGEIMFGVLQQSIICNYYGKPGEWFLSDFVVTVRASSAGFRSWSIML